MPSVSSLYRSIQTELGAWYDAYHRPLPWRQAVSAYHVLLSEVILQQTRVEQGLGYYHRFIEAFPSVEDLAQASEDEVLLLWQGLGYYSRGRNLRRAAQIIVSDYGGELPRTPKELSRLPGVGPYTRGAILSFAYDLPYPTVDGNVYRVLSRLFALSDPIDTPAGQRVYWALAEALLDRQHPSRHNQGLIELGALVCLPRRPRCGECPVGDYCEARRQGVQEQLPIKQGRTRVLPRYMNYFLVRIEGEGGTRCLIRRRQGRDIWHGLYEYPLIESGEEPLSVEALSETKDFALLIACLLSPRFHPVPLATHAHRLSHRQIYASLFLIECAGLISTPDYQVIAEEEQSSYAFPVLIQRLLEKIR